MQPTTQQAKLGLLRTLNKGVLDRFGGVSEVEATIANYELAFRMQSEVPDLLDLQKETRGDAQAVRARRAGYRGVRPRVPAGAPDGGARGALRRIAAAGAEGHRPLGPARRYSRAAIG